MEKVIEIIDLILTLLLVGSLITNIPFVNKSLTWVETNIDQGFKKFIKVTPHETIVWISNLCKKLFFITLIFMILVFYTDETFSL